MKSQVNLKEKISVHIGWIDCFVCYTQASSPKKVQGEAGCGLPLCFAVVQQV